MMKMTICCFFKKPRNLNVKMNILLYIFHHWHIVPSLPTSYQSILANNAKSAGYIHIIYDSFLNHCKPAQKLRVDHLLKLCKGLRMHHIRVRLPDIFHKPLENSFSKLSNGDLEWAFEILTLKVGSRIHKRMKTKSRNPRSVQFLQLPRQVKQNLSQDSNDRADITGLTETHWFYIFLFCLSASSYLHYSGSLLLRNWILLFRLAVS